MPSFKLWFLLGKSEYVYFQAYQSPQWVKKNSQTLVNNSISSLHFYCFMYNPY